MKFIETMCGDLINLEEIECFTFATIDKHLYSQVRIKKGEIYDLLDLPDTYSDEDNKRIELEPNDVVSLHRYALIFILRHDDNSVIQLDDIEEYAWKEFYDELEELKKRKDEILKEYTKAQNGNSSTRTSPEQATA